MSLSPFAANLANLPLMLSTCTNDDIAYRLQIGHAIRSCDVPSLYRDFGIVIINAIDTEVGVSFVPSRVS